MDIKDAFYNKIKNLMIEWRLISERFIYLQNNRRLFLFA